MYDTLPKLLYVFGHIIFFNPLYCLIFTSQVMLLFLPNTLVFSFSIYVVLALSIANLEVSPEPADGLASSAAGTSAGAVMAEAVCRIYIMMTSSNWNIFRVTGPLCGEFTDHRWIPRTKTSDAELWCFLGSAPWINGWVNNREAGDLRRHRNNYDVIVMTEKILEGLASHTLALITKSQIGKNHNNGFTE